MTSLRKIVVLVFIGVFVAAFILAALGATKKIEMVDGALTGIFAVLIGQCLTAIVTVFRSPDFWKDDPASVANIKRVSAELIEKTEAAADDAIAKLVAVHEKKEVEQIAANLELKRQLFEALKSKPQQVKRGPYGMPEK